MQPIQPDAPTIENLSSYQQLIKNTLQHDEHFIKATSSVPCCHHHLQVQIERQPAPAPFAPVLRHSILKERLGDILNDSLRVLILQIMGYQTDIVQFVSSEHTAKNLMMCAVKTHKPGHPHSIQEYNALKTFWNVTPYLEELLGAELRRFLIG